MFAGHFCVHPMHATTWWHFWSKYNYVYIITVGACYLNVLEQFVVYIFQCYYVLEIKNKTLLFTLYFCCGIIFLIIYWWNCSTASWNLFMHDLIKYNGHPFKKSRMSLFIKVTIFTAIILDVTYLEKKSWCYIIFPQYINWFQVPYCRYLFLDSESLILEI